MTIFEKYVDNDTLTENLVDDSLGFVKDKEAAYFQKKETRNDWAVHTAKNAERIKPKLIEKVRGQIRKDVVEWNGASSRQKARGPANILFTSEGAKKSITAQVLLREMVGHWRVTEITNGMDIFSKERDSEATAQSTDSDLR